MSNGHRAQGPSGSGIRIGILIQGWHVWHGSLVYVENMLAAVASLPPGERPRIRLVATTRHEAFSALLLHRHLELVEEVLLVDSLEYCRGGLRCVASRAELLRHVDCLLPAINLFPDLPAVNWIPDFQDRHLPHFFSDAELAQRRSWQDDLAAKAAMILLSSEDAAADLRRFYPDAAAKARILRFCTVPDASWYVPDPGNVAARYGIQEPYLVCCNQFWAHKNHGVLFRALGRCASQGFAPLLVCTGLNVDHRNQEYFDGLMAEAAAQGIAGRIRCLGFINRDDQIQLVRGAMAMVQPSLFEGWSTVVEDARCLGKRIFLSGIGVHQEQAPARGTFFDPHDPEDLARRLLAAREELAAEPDAQAEAEARLQAGQRVRDYVHSLVAIAAERAAMGPTAPAADAAAGPLDRAAFTCALTGFQELLGREAENCQDRLRTSEERVQALGQEVRDLSGELEKARKPRSGGWRRLLGF